MNITISQGRRSSKPDFVDIWVLQRYSDALGSRRQMYRNHALRCFNYHPLLLRADPPDVAVLAWAIHDLGIMVSRSARLGEILR